MISIGSNLYDGAWIVLQCLDRTPMYGLYTLVYLYNFAINLHELEAGIGTLNAEQGRFPPCVKLLYFYNGVGALLKITLR